MSLHPGEKLVDRESALHPRLPDQHLPLELLQEDRSQERVTQMEKSTEPFS